jgi:hypothetical protein
MIVDSGYATIILFMGTQITVDNTLLYDCILIQIDHIYLN